MRSSLSCRTKLNALRFSFLAIAGLIGFQIMLARIAQGQTTPAIPPAQPIPSPRSSKPEELPQHEGTQNEIQPLIPSGQLPTPTPAPSPSGSPGGNSEIVGGITQQQAEDFDRKFESAPEVRDRIIDPLIAYNEAKAGPRNQKEFTFSVHSETGEFVGGLLGFTHWNHFFVSAVFVDQDFRRGGIGRELMQRAEALALQQGCDAIYLDTFDYQAPGFYEKLGFRVFGKLEDYPPGHRRFYLVKQIRNR